MIHDQSRVDAIRKRITAGLAMVQQMDVVQDENFRKWLRLARNSVHDIASIYLADLEERDRSTSEEAVWLSTAEQFMAIAEQECQKLYELFQKHGKDLKMLG